MLRRLAGRARPAQLVSIVLTLLPLTALTLFATDRVYRSVSIDEGGQLHVLPESGKEILPRKTHGQVSFDAPMISPDSRTIGWLAMYPYPAPPDADYHAAPIPGGLVIYRAGRVIHTFTTQQSFWDWQFRDGGKRVAYSTGPTDRKSVV